MRINEHSKHQCTFFLQVLIYLHKMTAISTPCIILPTESKPGKPNPRLAQYKACNISNQEERRLKLLQEQKK